MTTTRQARSRPLQSDKDVLHFINDELLPLLRQQQLMYAALIGGFIGGGAGAPTVAPAGGATVALWLRNDGGAGTSLYLYRAGAWVAIA
jgi:hypothetical protein